MNAALNKSVGSIINNLDPEFRIPVITAFNASDGTVSGFIAELQCAQWEIPDLPVDEIVSHIGA